MSISVEVIINGKSAKQFSHDGRMFIEGRKGSEYALRFKNHSSRRQEVVASIDGLSILDGKTASNTSQGYVLGPWQTADIPGWRLNSSEVAAFQFGNKPDSYAAASGKPTNVGFIGVKVFREYIRPRPIVHHFVPVRSYPRHSTPNRGWYDDNSEYMFGSAIAKSSLASPQASAMKYGGTGGRGMSSGASGSVGDSVGMNACSFMDTEPSQIATQDLGTEFGEKTAYVTGSTSFTRDTSYPNQEIVIYYDSRRALERRGIKVVLDHQEQKWANPFPGDGCTPPDNWKG